MSLQPVVFSWINCSASASGCAGCLGDSTQHDRKCGLWYGNANLFDAVLPINPDESVDFEKRYGLRCLNKGKVSDGILRQLIPLFVIHPDDQRESQAHCPTDSSPLNGPVR